MATRTRIEIDPINPVVGAVASGADLSRSFDPEEVATIRKAVLTHGAVFFRDQDITQADTVAFLKNFGELCTDPFAKASLEKVPDEFTVHDMQTYGNGQATALWHMDSTLGAEPAAFLTLRALELPPSGGSDTCWGSMYAAYETLSQPVRDMIDGLEAEHSGYKTLPLLGLGYGETLQQDMRNTHPVVRVHPETGRKALFVNELWTEKIVGVSSHESQSILDMLWKHSQRPEFTMRWKWQVNDIVMWDNMAFQHYAVNDYEGSRVLQKGYVKGDRPVGPG
ncbi:MAG: TauD/TfdA family dioxygenase [Novosphingobium sp.]|nr:TauD/TfdA family dioxygenase [Novosphingobium sp.]